MPEALCFIHALTSVHAGAGQGIDAIDLPIARERATALPFIPGSSLKGCLRDRAQQNPDISDADRRAIFGGEKPGANGEAAAGPAAGAISVGDAQLALFPVRSLAGTFVWATSPFLLLRLRRDAQAAGLHGLPAIPQPAAGQAEMAHKMPLILTNKLILEEYDLTANTSSPDAESWAAWLAGKLFPQSEDADFRDALQQRLVILSDATLFSLARTATEIQAHIAMDKNTGTVQDGALWYQESLPAETVLVSLLRAAPRKGRGLSGEEILNLLLPGDQTLQIGGKAGTGQGWVRIARAGGAA